MENKLLKARLNFNKLKTTNKNLIGDIETNITDLLLECANNSSKFDHTLFFMDENGYPNAYKLSRIKYAGMGDGIVFYVKSADVTLGFRELFSGQEFKALEYLIEDIKSKKDNEFWKGLNSMKNDMFEHRSKLITTLNKIFETTGLEELTVDCDIAYYDDGDIRVKYVRTIRKNETFETITTGKDDNEFILANNNYDILLSDMLVGQEMPLLEAILTNNEIDCKENE